MDFWSRPNLIDRMDTGVDCAKVNEIRTERRSWLEHPNWSDLPEFFSKMPKVEDLPVQPRFDGSGPFVNIGEPSDVTEDQLVTIETTAKRLQPWRKGPFKIFGVEIDAEWRSDLKWKRIESALGSLRSKRVLDLGCGNGYYMFRAAALEPQFVWGLDPSVQFFYAFEFFQWFARQPNLQYDLLGFEHLDLFDQAFDVALCMGILYHHRSPIEILRDLKKSLAVGGVAIIESQTIDGEGTFALFPEDRYAKARNVFFVPTKDCLINWVKRAGFKNVELVDHCKVTPAEQRRTEWMTWESLSDFLDADDESKTIEGYPAPYRTVIRAERKFL